MEKGLMGGPVFEWGRFKIFTIVLDAEDDDGHDGEFSRNWKGKKKYFYIWIVIVLGENLNSSGSEFTL